MTAPASPALAGPGTGRWSRRIRAAVAQLYGRATTAIGTTIFLIFLLLALFGPLIAPYGANQQIPGAARQPPSAAHWFGTDTLGRDVFSRVVLGARDVLSLAGLGTLLAVTLGTLIGLVSGYRGGLLDEAIMRLFDSLLSLPALMLALLLLGSLGASRTSVFIVIVVAYTPIVARVVRSVTLSVRTRGYVEAARAQAESFFHILFREILPSTLPALAVEAALRFSYAIFLVSSLGFLGVGVQPPAPDWGLMVPGWPTVLQTPWAMYFPVAAIAIVVVGVNLLADGLKQILQAPSQIGG